METRAGPSVASSDPEERKLARTLRIQRREKAIAFAKINKNDEEEEVVITKTPVEVQVEKSNRILSNLLVEGDAYVRNIRRAADIRLQERNKINDVTKQRIETEFEVQAKEAEEKFDEIITKWAGLTILNDPLQIHEAILHQKSQCVGLLKKKDEFIQKLKLELIEIDKNFDKDVAKQKDDMEILTHRINLQIKYLRTAFEKQFHAIQGVVQSEQQKFFKMRNDLWNDLYKKYMEKEHDNSEFIIEQRNEMRHLLIETRDRFAEELRQTNIRLDIDVHVSRDELERIKAIVKNNLEKWEYNFWILESRRNENVFIKAEQKKKITSLQGRIIGLQRNLRDFYNEMAKKIRRHEESLKKVKHDILQIEDKADRFAASNEILFNQIWDLNRKAVFDILDKIYQIDKTLHQQQLGLPWNEPNIKDIDKQLMPSYQHALTIIHNAKQQRKPTTKNTSGSIISQGPKKENEPSLFAESVQDFNLSYRRLVRHLMSLISDKSGFLTESRLQRLLRKFEDKDRNLIKLWNVFDSLDINGIDEIDALITYFLPYCFCPVCVDSGDPSSNSDTLHDALSESDSSRSGTRNKSPSRIPRPHIYSRKPQTVTQNTPPPSEDQEETDLFEDTTSTPSLASQDNKVHLKRASAIEKTGFIPPPPPLDVNKMKLDFNRINELDRIHNIPIGRNFFGHLLRPQTEKLRKSYLKDRDCLPGPSNIPAKKRKKMRVAGMTSDSEDDVTPLDDMKSVTNCIVENTLNKLNVDEVKANKDDVIEFNLVPVEETEEQKLEELDSDVDMENNGNNVNDPKPEGDSGTPISQNVPDENLSEPVIENYRIRLAVDLLLPIEHETNFSHCPIANTISPLYPQNVAPMEILPDLSIEILPNIPYLVPQIPSQLDDINDQDEMNGKSIARASREAIVDPNSVQDLLADFDVNATIDELNGVDILDLGNVILVGIHPLSENIDVEQNTNGFPNWLLHILGTQAPISEMPMDGTLEEPHYYCQGDGLGVHPSVIAVDVNEVDSDDEHSSQSSDNTNTTDFAEIDPGMSSQDMSSLPEDSIDTILTTELQDCPDEADEREPSSAPASMSMNCDTESSSSDMRIQTSKSL